jgi:hypothetical protein
MYDIWKDIHTVLPGNNVTLFEYLGGIHNSIKTRKKTPNISTNKTYKNRKTIIGNIQNQV